MSILLAVATQFPRTLLTLVKIIFDLSHQTEEFLSVEKVMLWADREAARGNVCVCVRALIKQIG